MEYTLTNKPQPLGLSIITATYNRKRTIHRSIDSSLDLIKKNHANELIIIDDGSTDGTYEFVTSKYAQSVEKQEIKLHRLEKNQGVTNAKNIGVRLATGEWCGFMDSDDFFTKDAGTHIQQALSSFKKNDLIFFRCMDLNNRLIGPKKRAGTITLKDIYNNGTPGECLTIIRRSTILKHPYPASLRGCESLAYFSMLNNGATAFVSDKCVRMYDTLGFDRLSRTNIKRAEHLLSYNLAIIKYLHLATPKRVIGILIRIAYYSTISVIMRATHAVRKTS